MPVAASSGGSADRSGSRRPGPRGCVRRPTGPRGRGRGGRRAPRPSSTSASTDARRSRRVARRFGPACRGREVGRPRSAMRRSGRACRAPDGVRLGVGHRRLGRAAAPAGLRPPDAVVVGRAVDLARAARAGRRRPARSSNMLNRLAALLVPSRAHASTASAAASSSSSSRCRSSGCERRQDVVDAAADRVADPDPEAAELLGAELVDDRAQAVVAAVAAALAEPELAERQREVVGDDQQVAQRRVLAGQHLADGEAGVVHERQRLDERQVEARGSGPSRRSRRRAAGPGPPSRPARRSGRGPASRCCAASPRTAPGIPETDDDLHRPSARETPSRDHTRARSRPGGPAGMVAAIAAGATRGTDRGPGRPSAGQQPALERAHRAPPRLARRGPSRRRAACRG